MAASMTTGEQVNLVKAQIEDTDITDDQIKAYLLIAGNAILRRLYSAYAEVPDVSNIPESYQILQCLIAARYVARRGAEGELSHSESGISRSWANAADEDLLRQITPYVGVPK